MIEFLSMGKHTAFVYTAYIFSVIVLVIGFYIPHFILNREVKKKKNENNKDK